MPYMLRKCVKKKQDFLSGYEVFCKCCLDLLLPFQGVGVHVHSV